MRMEPPFRQYWSSAVFTRGKGQCPSVPEVEGSLTYGLSISTPTFLSKEPVSSFQSCIQAAPLSSLHVPG